MVFHLIFRFIRWIQNLIRDRERVSASKTQISLTNFYLPIPISFLLCFQKLWILSIEIFSLYSLKHK